MADRAPPPDALASVAIKLMRAALWVMPRSIRISYGADILATFVQRLCENNLSRRDRLILTAAELAGLIQHGIAERLETVLRRRAMHVAGESAGRQRRRRVAIGVIAAAGAGAAVPTGVLLWRVDLVSFVPVRAERHVQLWPGAVMNRALVAMLARQLPDVQLLSAAALGRARLGGGEYLTAAMVTRRYLEARGSRIAMGNLNPNAHQHDTLSVVLSDRTWREQFSGDLTILGKSMRMEGLHAGWVRIEGVLTAEGGPINRPREAMWVFANETNTAIDEDHNWSFNDVVGVLSSTATLASAQEQLRSVAATLAKEYPDLFSSVAVEEAAVLPLRWPADRTTQDVLGFVAGFGLLVVLLTILAVRRFLNLRADPGESAAKVLSVRLEPVLYGACAAGAVAVFRWLTGIAQDRPPPERTDTVILTCIVAVAITSCAWLLLYNPIRRRTRASRVPGTSAVGVQAMFAAVLVALAIGILTVRGRVIREWRTAETAGLVALRVAPRGGGPVRSGALPDVSRLAGAANITRAAYVQALPAAGQFWGAAVELVGDTAAGRPADSRLHFISADYPETFGLRVVAGRTFTPDDVLHGRALVGTSFARAHGGSAAILGKRLYLRGTRLPSFEVVGVLRDPEAIENRGHNGEVYLPLTFASTDAVWLVATGGSGTGAMLSKWVSGTEDLMAISALVSVPALMRRSVEFRDRPVRIAAFLALLAALMATVLLAELPNVQRHPIACLVGASLGAFGLIVTASRFAQSSAVIGAAVGPVALLLALLLSVGIPLLLPTAQESAPRPRSQ